MLKLADSSHALREHPRKTTSYCAQKRYESYRDTSVPNNRKIEDSLLEGGCVTGIRFAAYGVVGVTNSEYLSSR